MASNVPKFNVFVFSGPSGAGKSTLLKMLIEKYPNRFGFSVSHTTRKIRPGEENGKDYFFTDRETIQKEIADGNFLEHAEFAGNIYGTSRHAVQSVLNCQKYCILDVDFEGVKSIHKCQPPLQSLYILILPPTIEELEKRLRDRGTETEETISKRLERAQRDMNFVQTSDGRKLFNVVIRNDNVGRSFTELEKYILPSLMQK